MTETKRFLIDDAGELIDLNNHKFIDYGDECCKLLNGLSDEVMDLRAENTKFKLVLSDVVEDLEKQAKSKEPIILSEEYVNWIKENVNLNFFSKKGDVE